MSFRGAFAINYANLSRNCINNTVYRREISVAEILQFHDVNIDVKIMR